MNQITAVIVDDEESDRYIAKRRLAKAEHFSEVIEAPNGDAFLEEYFSHHKLGPYSPPPLLILMDVNMPGKDGFKTV